MDGRTNGANGSPNPVGFWNAATTLAEYQRKMFANWTQWLQSSLPLAPANLWQSILPNWDFGPQITINTGRSSDPALEDKIVSDVAGYGSQLGTILDYLDVLESKERLLAKPLAKDDKVKVARLMTLVDQVNTTKAKFKAPK